MSRSWRNCLGSRWCPFFRERMQDVTHDEENVADELRTDQDSRSFLVCPTLGGRVLLGCACTGGQNVAKPCWARGFSMFTMMPRPWSKPPAPHTPHCDWTGAFLCAAAGCRLRLRSSRPQHRPLRLAAPKPVGGVASNEYFR